MENIDFPKVQIITFKKKKKFNAEKRLSLVSQNEMAG